MTKPKSKHLDVRLFSDAFSKNGIKAYFQSPTKVFVSLAAIFGLAMIFVMPLFQVPDETVHFYRAYQIGEGHLTSQSANGQTGGYVREVAKDGNYFKTTNDDPEKFIAFPSSAIYSPIPYIPQAIGIDVGRVIHPTVESMVHFGRLFNLIAYIALVALAIKIARQGKWVYAAVGLFPVAIQEAASLATDVMTTGLVFITIAFAHSLFLRTEPIRRRQLLSIGALALALGLTKQTNIFVLIPFLFLPASLFGGIKLKILKIVPILALSLVAMIGWYGVMQLSNYNTDYATTLNLNGVDPPEQAKYLIQHPLSFIETSFRSFVFEGFKSPPTPDFYLTSMYGYFSSLTYKLPLPFIFLGYILLIITLLHREGVNARVKEKVFAKLALVQGVTFLLGVGAIAGALYIVWTPVGAPQIAGIQGRYFIPLLPLLIPVFQYFGKFVRVSFDQPYRLGVLLAGISTLNLVAMIAITYRWFY